MFSENIWQRLRSLIDLTWQNPAFWLLPCSVSSFLRTRFKNVIAPHCDASIEKWRHNRWHIWGASQVFGLQLFMLTQRPQVTLIAGSFALFNVSLTVHTRGYWDQQPVNISCSDVGQKRCRLHWLHAASFTFLQSRKMTEPWWQNVTKVIARVDLNQSLVHDYLSKGCMTYVWNVWRNKW